ncbi:hypothetical protein E4U52_006812 [Claviceps spartinae]|nr:hypothetical protein E4U52_006812 [Claviceps spartinae]
MRNPANRTIYALQDVPGKGKGLVATKHIPKGTRITSEEALFTISGYKTLGLEDLERLSWVSGPPTQDQHCRRGRELTIPYRKGYSVAVIDAVQWVFDAGGPVDSAGIRLEDPRMIKIFSLPLPLMLALGDQECQTAGWTTKNHKCDCKFLKDPDVRALFLFKWDEAQVCDGFPLRVAE